MVEGGRWQGEKGEVCENESNGDQGQKSTSMFSQRGMVNERVKLAADGEAVRKAERSSKAGKGRA